MTEKTKQTLRKDPVDQKRANALKTIRAAIRLKYSIMADNELNVALPKFEQEYNAAINNDEQPDPLAIAKTIFGG